MDSTIDIAQSLIRIPQVITVAELTLGLVLALLIFVLIGHVLHGLGQQTILYKAKPPVKNWNRRFYPAISLLLVIIAVLLLWLQHYRASL